MIDRVACAVAFMFVVSLLRSATGVAVASPPFVTEAVRPADCLCAGRILTELRDRSGIGRRIVGGARQLPANTVRPAATRVAPPAFRTPISRVPASPLRDVPMAIVSLPSRPFGRRLPRRARTTGDRGTKRPRELDRLNASVMQFPHLAPWAVATLRHSRKAVPHRSPRRIFRRRL